MRTKYLSIPVIIMGMLVLTVTSCKDDSTSSEDISIEILNVTQSLIELNECDIDSGLPASEFLFEMEYVASTQVDIDGVEFDLNWSSGDQSHNIFTNDFNDDEGTLLFDWCFRYSDNEDWFELDLKILAEDEEVESNEVTIRVDKPENANKRIAR